MIKKTKTIRMILLLFVIILTFSSCDLLNKLFPKKNTEESSSSLEEVPPPIAEVEVENNIMPNDIKDILVVDGNDKAIENIIEFESSNTEETSQEASSQTDNKVSNNKSSVTNSSSSTSASSTKSSTTTSSSKSSNSSQAPVSSQPTQSSSQATSSINEDDLNERLSKLATDVFTLINKERTDADIPALIADSTLTKAAGIRSKEAMDRPDLGHTRPDGTGAHTVLNDVEYTKSGVIMGENLVFTAYDATAEKLVELWRNSESHRINYMDPDFTYTGISINYNSESDFTLACVQLFTN